MDGEPDYLPTKSSGLAFIGTAITRRKALLRVGAMSAALLAGPLAALGLRVQTAYADVCFSGSSGCRWYFSACYTCNFGVCGVSANGNHWCCWNCGCTGGCGCDPAYAYVKCCDDGCEGGCCLCSGCTCWCP